MVGTRELRTASSRAETPPPDFHAETLRGARAVRARIVRDLGAALAAGELRSGTDVATLAKLVETT